MMKKFLALTCMIACIFGMTACGSEEEYTDYEWEKMDEAVYKATDELIPCIQELMDDEYYREELQGYTKKEIETQIREEYELDVDGYAFVSALDSFAKTYEEIGGDCGIMDAQAVIDGKQIIVTVDVAGYDQDAKAEVVFSNDKFLVMQAASLNKVDTFGSAMIKAALNTLLGMGTVFIVLILISLIISWLGIVPKLLEGRKAEKAEDVKTKGIEKAVTQIAAQEAADAADDLELVAVIAAAIAASEGAASTDGFVVRSIKRRKA